MGGGCKRREQKLREDRLGEGKERQMNPSEVVKFRGSYSGKTKV